MNGDEQLQAEHEQQVEREMDRNTVFQAVSAHYLKHGFSPTLNVLTSLIATLYQLDEKQLREH